MNITHYIGKHLRETYFGNNWTSVNFKEVLHDVTWFEATKKIYDLNTIAVLLFHVNYYLRTITKVLQGHALDSKDEYSFTHPTLHSDEDWSDMVKNSLEEVEKLTKLIELLPDDLLWNDFTDEKYGNYYRNLHGAIEHCHYHLGQIVLIKKILRSEKK